LLDYGIMNIPSSVNNGTMNSGNRQQSIDVPSGRDNMDALVLNADFVKRCAGIVLVVVLYYFNWVVGLAVSILFGIFLWRENMVRRQIIQLSNINLKSNKRSQIKWYDHTIGKLEIGFFDQVPGSENIINEKNDLSVFLPEELNPIIEKASQSLNRWKEIFLVVGIIGTGFLTYIGMMGFSNWVAVLYIFAMIHLYVQLSRVGIDMSTEVKPLLPDTTFSQRPVLRRAGDIQITKLSFQSSDNEDDDILNLSTRFRKGSSSAIFSEFSSSPITLLKLLGGVVTAPENSIFINRIDITSIDIRAYQERIGYVHQNGYIFSDTIEMNITGPDTITDHKWLQNIIDSVGLRQWVEQLEYGVSTPIGIGGKKLSMAITQRVLIARALYRHPDYLLLENAFCYLDPRSVYRVMKEIRRILPDVTIIAISNVLPVLSFVDGVKFIKNGRLIEEGSHSELMYKRGVYYHSINPLEEVLN
ncbi:MAG: ATP-binding cassette domain-containing protein, partial [Bacteroidia bacterium]|nr:ATP-binding cassette domain-containing protein [Bacteroidia bacterium]